MSKVFSLDRDSGGTKIFAGILTAMIVVASWGVLRVRHAAAFDLSSLPPCYDISGQGKAWPLSGTPPVLNPGGVPNSGVMNFDKTGGAPADIYEACVVDPGGQYFELRGWAWNDNLGWVSFYCPAGVPAGNPDPTVNNMGANCSDAAGYTGGYGVKIDRTTGKFSGYAWGDNAGWISFDNDPYSLVQADGTASACQGYVYTDANAPFAGCPSHATEYYTAAWSDQVGWIDFDGIKLPWFLLVGISDPVVTLTSSVDGKDPTEIDKTNAPAANGSDFYTLNVLLQDQNGDPLPPDYIVKLSPVWTKDSVKKDQTDPAAAVDNINCDQPSGAVTKPCVSLTAADFENYSGNIFSIAPTSNMNCWHDPTSLTPGSCDFSYESFVNPPMAALESNDLLFDGVNISVEDNNGVCLFGLAPACSQKLVLPTYSGSGDQYLKFKPATEVTDLKDPNGSGKLINLSFGGNLASAFPVTVSGNDQVDFHSGINPPPDASVYPYAFDFGVDASTPLDYNAATTDLFHAGSSTTYSGGLFAGIAVGQDSNGQTPQVPQLIPGEYIYSIVNGSDGVKYYSNKLPKNVGSLAATPVAVLKGNVYSTGAVTTTTTIQQPIRSLGDVSTNILRDTIYKNVLNIVAGAQPQNGQDVTLESHVVMPGEYAGFTNNGGSLQTFLQDESGEPKVYYHSGGGDVIVGHVGGDVRWTGERTIIVIGGNVHIESNLIPSALPGSPKPKLGIIVLKDLTRPNVQNTGNIYIDPSVTNIQANMFADGAVFSECDPAQCTLGQFGESIYNSDTDAKNALKFSQLRIEGSIASQNTIGGASIPVKAGPPATGPILGDGTLAAGPNALMRARAYDLNYLRYYSGVLKYDPGTGDVTCPDGTVTTDEQLLPEIVKAADGTPNTVYDSPQGCLYSPVDFDSGAAGSYKSAFSHTGTPFEDYVNLGSTYVIFDPPTSTLPGFSAQGGGSQKQLPQ